MVAVKEVSFKLKEGEFVSIVGPSGCGKTTLLMCIAGLMETSGGQILLNEKKVNCPPKEMVLIFQNYINSLFPWRTVFGNVLFALLWKIFLARNIDGSTDTTADIVK